MAKSGIPKLMQGSYAGCSMRMLGEGHLDWKTRWRSSGTIWYTQNGRIRDPLVGAPCLYCLQDGDVDRTPFRAKKLLEGAFRFMIPFEWQLFTLGGSLPWTRAMLSMGGGGLS